MDEEIAAVHEALAGLNRALAQLVPKGVKAEISTIESFEIGEPMPRTIVTIHLTKVKIEIDLQL